MFNLMTDDFQKLKNFKKKTKNKSLMTNVVDESNILKYAPYRTCQANNMLQTPNNNKLSMNHIAFMNPFHKLNLASQSFTNFNGCLPESPKSSFGIEKVLSNLKSRVLFALFLAKLSP